MFRKFRQTFKLSSIYEAVGKAIFLNQEEVSGPNSVLLCLGASTTRYQENIRYMWVCARVCLICWQPMADSKSLSSITMSQRGIMLFFKHPHHLLRREWSSEASRISCYWRKKILLLLENGMSPPVGIFKDLERLTNTKNIWHELGKETECSLLLSGTQGGERPSSTKPVTPY